MYTNAEFRSSKFPAYEGEQDLINPGMWGRKLTEYLVEKLTLHKLSVSEPIAKDWGYYIPAKIDDKILAVCCGHQWGDDDQFICFTDPDKPIIKNYSKKWMLHSN
jgi:hypothetical protein